ncbi:MAG: hypothetical protein M0C28_38920 [Candidatus Moduliflexus flocculans]|nr:hypothetical protein [Candidatus Moduliflexus flocculans]
MNTFYTPGDRAGQARPGGLRRRGDGLRHGHAVRPGPRPDVLGTRPAFRLRPQSPSARWDTWPLGAACEGLDRSPADAQAEAPRAAPERADPRRPGQKRAAWRRGSAPRLRTGDRNASSSPPDAAAGWPDSAPSKPLLEGLREAPHRPDHRRRPRGPGSGGSSS